MGKRGPAATPTKILALEGSWRANARKGEPQPESGPPACPDWLDDEAKDVWEQTIPMLDAMKVLSKADVNALVRYCTMFVRWKKAEQFLSQHGEVYPLKDESGKVKYFQQFPQVAIAHKLALALLRIEQEFGLTPASRTRINIHGRSDQEPDALDRWQAELRHSRSCGG